MQCMQKLHFITCKCTYFHRSLYPILPDGNHCNVSIMYRRHGLHIIGIQKRGLSEQKIPFLIYKTKYSKKTLFYFFYDDKDCHSCICIQLLS